MITSELKGSILINSFKLCPFEVPFQGEKILSPNGEKRCRKEPLTFQPTQIQDLLSRRGVAASFDQQNPFEIPCINLLLAIFFLDLLTTFLY